MYYIFVNNYKYKRKKYLDLSIWILSIIRIILCLLPQNNWITNDSSLMIGIIRNVPFVILGIIIIIMYFNKKSDDKCFKNIWIFVLLSFLFYIPVVVGASSIPILGMFMLPKTICYILIILTFRRKVLV